MAKFPFPKTAKFVQLSVFAIAAAFALPGERVHAAEPKPALAKAAAENAVSLIDRWTPLIKEASRRFGIAEDWIKAVMRLESGGRTTLKGQPITSSAGAMGLMQVMPETYENMRQQHGLGADPYDPRDNVLAGTAYLRWLHEKYGYPRMFAAYNAGPGALEAELAGSAKLPSETRAYVKGIARLLGTGSDSLPATVVPEAVTGPASLTRPDGSSFAVEGATVDSIRASLPNEYVPGVQTVLTIGERRQGVTEDVGAVAALLSKYGWKGEITKPIGV